MSLGNDRLEATGAAGPDGSSPGADGTPGVDGGPGADGTDGTGGFFSPLSQRRGKPGGAGGAGIAGGNAADGTAGLGAQAGSDGAIGLKLTNGTLDTWIDLWLFGNGDNDIIKGVGGAGGNGTAGSDGLAGADGQKGLAIDNDGKVFTGLGDDTVDTLQGGFGGTGQYFLGLGRDTVKGYGSGTFFGGAGCDGLVLQGSSSNYTITQIGSSTVDFTVQLAGDPSSPLMTLYSFESISYV